MTLSTYFIIHTKISSHVYAIVPETTVHAVLSEQARIKAEAIVKRASSHMALEKQSLTPDQMEQEIKQLAERLLVDRPSDFWEL